MENEQKLSDATAEFECTLKRLTDTFMSKSTDKSRASMIQCIKNTVYVYIMDCKDFGTNEILKQID